jgi:putative Mg2+ transporter-C (MgtC) family protein
MWEHTLLPGAIPAAEMALRLGVAALLGMALGLDRELRGIPAGIRTHGLVALSAAAVTVSGLMLYAEVRAGGGDSDPLRVVQGIFQAISFIGVGLVFVARGEVHNLTTAASLMLSAGIGIAAGAGQHALAAMAVGIGVVLLTLVRLLERLILGSKGRRHNGGRTDGAAARQRGEGPAPPQ